MTDTAGNVHEIMVLSKYVREYPLTNSKFGYRINFFDGPDAYQVYLFQQARANHMLYSEWEAETHGVYPNTVPLATYYTLA